MNAQQWAFAELDTANMHVARRKRRQERGYTKKTADDLVAWAEEQDRRAVA